MKLLNKVAMITGAGSGIGQAAALKLNSEGAKIALIGRTPSKLEKVRLEIERTGGTAICYPGNVTNKTEIDEIVSSISSLGTIEILVNNAGFNSNHRRLLTTTQVEINDVLEANLKGAIYCVQAVTPQMKKAGCGTIINIGSIAGITPSSLGGMIYGASKAALLNFTSFLNEDLKNTGIRASILCPGEVDTPFLNKRPVPPSVEARTMMIAAEDVAEIISLIATLPIRTNIPIMTIVPTFKRESALEKESNI
jgi:NADP-dependent 3-hydroxy acid dehydrogenase YdfG